jgi:two-component system chemotaxis response regulator CheY
MAKLKVMIVDDSSLIRQAIQKNLKEYDIEVVGQAEDGEMALDLFEKNEPEYVTLDITMPKVDGLTVLEQILKKKPDTKVLVVTALSDKDTALKALELGAKGFIVKPFTPEKLKESFGRLIQE